MKRGVAAILFFAIIALILACVATAINYWWYYKTGSVRVYFGLWHVCSKVTSGDAFACQSWRDLSKSVSEGWIRTCQAMMLLSVMLYAFGVVLILLHVTIFVHTRQLVKLAGILFCIGGACNCVGFIVFASEYKNLSLVKLVLRATPNCRLHAGFGLAVASTVFGFLSGIVALSVKSNSYESI